MKIKINVSGMMCEHCAKTVEDAAKNVSGVESVKVNLKKKNITIKCSDETTTTSLIDAINSVGYKATI